MKLTSVITLLPLTLCSVGACSSSHGGTGPPPSVLRGKVESGRLPLPQLEVTLYAAGTSRAQVLGEAVSDDDGEFTIDYQRPEGDPVLYAVARGSGSSPVALMAVLGTVDAVPDSIVVNELTTVASVWTTAQFLQGDELRGNEIGLRNAASNVGNLIDVSVGGAGDMVLSGVNVQTTTLSKLYSLGDILSTCVRASDCRGLFENATPPGGTEPKDTLEAALNVALNPWNNIERLFRLLPSPQDEDTPIADVPYEPFLRYHPTDWTLSLVYTGGGLDAPGGISIDAEGFVWTNNNFLVGSQSFLRQEGFPGLGATKLTPNGRPLSPGFGFVGGGIFGAGFGLAIDQRGHIWVGNFAGESVSELTSDGEPVSGDSGYPAGGEVQGTVVDQSGNVWAANFSAQSVTEYPAGDPDNPQTFGGPHCTHQIAGPFGLAIDHDGKVWVASQLSNSLLRIDPDAIDGCPDAPVDIGSFPMGVAIDSLGNIWVANDRGPDVTLYNPSSGLKVHYGEGSFTGPWGIAVDGADNVWVADFFGRRVVELCGAPENCPSGFTTGQRISPREGYVGAGGIQHITSVVIDQAGNVWVANNQNDQLLCDHPPPLETPPSLDLEVQSMKCGGNGVMVFFGLAAPVAAPLIGPPVQP